jgi:hypothetical protein
MTRSHTYLLGIVCKVLNGVIDMIDDLIWFFDIHLFCQNQKIIAREVLPFAVNAQR